MTVEQKKLQDDTLWDAWLDKYMQRLEQETVKAEDIGVANEMRKEVMNATNPRLLNK
jgi:hypothetical protein